MCRKLMRKNVVLEMVGLSWGTVRRLYLAGEFPMPVQLTAGGSVAFFEEDVESWINSRQVVTPETQRKVAPGNPKRGRPRKTLEAV